ncbi:hypothetical protein KJ611_00215 [Patescibacteria group bacterium]|nr:hypothetical protein [Patescibacteria group bacterium]MBU1705665.1 hypothetical protein [Patescibacteria group bacterium]
MLKKISTIFRDVYHILNNLMIMSWNLVDKFLDRFRNDQDRLRRQIASFVLEFHTLIPKSSTWDQIRDDLNTVLNLYLPTLMDRKHALKESQGRVKIKLAEMQTGDTNNGAIKNIHFALENKKILEQKLKETDEQIRYALDFLNNLEALVVANMDQAGPPEMLMHKASEFIQNIHLTGFEDTEVQSEITTEIDGFKVEH